MVTDKRSAGPWREVEYDGYEPLRIGDLKVHLLGKTTAGSSAGNRPTDGLLRIITEDGVEGWCNHISPDTAHVIVDQFREHLVGRDALARERIWHDLLEHRAAERRNDDSIDPFPMIGASWRRQTSSGF